MESSGIARNSWALVTVVAVAALLIALYTVISQLSGPAVYGPDDTEITVSAGDRFTIEVPDAPDDAFHWIVADPRPDPAVLKAGANRPAPDDPPGRPSSSDRASRALDFEAVRPGRADLRLLYCRRCMTGAADEPGARTLNFRIMVR
ncbi:hypothetical protein ACFC0M_39045 [Streptomyces sp. NPDC056149]|uniref:hypothetical protein n=1 Tax=Streptomyces sp. NPDC056149 TaxID=3345728 RepID=UPI0035D704C5